MSPLALLLASQLFLSPSPSLSPSPAHPAGPSVDTVFDALARVRRFHDVAISPDGKRVAWSEKMRDRSGRESLGTISVVDLPTGRTRRLAAAPGGPPRDEHGAAFSPDGAWIAFLSDAAEKDQAQIWIAPAAGGPARQLTRVHGQLAQLRWSADGAAIAFLFVEGSRQKTGALVAYKRDSGVVAETIEEQRIAVVPVRSGSVRTLSPPDLYVYDYDWSADGRSFAAEAAVGSGTNNYWVAQLYVIAADTGAVRSIWKPPLQIACPRFSPDGKSVAVIHGLMSDEGSTGGDIWVVPVSGDAPSNKTPEMRASARAIFWRAPDEILFAEAVDGGRGLAALDPGTGKIAALWTGAEALDDLAVAAAGRVCAGVISSFRKPPEVWAGPVGEWKAVTRVNAAATPFWGEAKSLHWQSDGATVQGWLLYPMNFDSSRRYPMVVSIHGGPSADQSIGWPSRWNGTLPSQGYFVFLPNPRGSFGFGEDFARANVKDFGGGDLRDVLTGVDEVLRAAPVDGQRVAIIGWSYGGYMAMWAVTQTTRFAAAVAGAGIADWRSYYGQNKIDTWMLPFFGASVYDDPAVYARSSPIEFIKKVKTPTLLLHGERDSEVPTPQGYEFWHALKSLGVDTQLAIYTDEGHDVQQPEHQRDIVARAVGWLDTYLKKGATP